MTTTVTRHMNPTLAAPVVWTSRSSKGPDGEDLPVEALLPFSPVQVDRRWLALDGVALVDGHVVRGQEDLLHALPSDVGSLTFDEIGSWWSRHCANPSVLYVADELRGELGVFPDPLGGGVVFRYDWEQGTGLSSDLASLVDAARAAGCPVDVDMDHQIQRVLLGIGGNDVSPIAQIDPLPPRSYAVVGPRGAQIRPYTVFEERAGARYEDLVDLIADQLASSLAAIASLDVPVVGHLTGGFDSRLVLAAALGAGVEKELHFFCSGPDGTADRVIADSLTQQFGLRRSSTDANANAGFRTQTERQLAAMVRSVGLTETGPTGQETRQVAVAVAGGYGEMYRPAPGHPLPPDAPGIDVLTRSVPRFSEASSWVRPKTLARVAGQMGRAWHQSARGPGRPDGLGDRHWLNVRGRYHFGANSLATSRLTPRFDPLYTLGGALMVDAVPLAERRDNIVGFDVMRRLAPQLLEVPFETYDRFGPLVDERRRRPPLREHPTWKRPETVGLPLVRPDAPPSLDAMRAVLDGVDLSPPTEEKRNQAIARANELHLPFWQVLSLEQTQAVMARALDVLDTSVLDADVDVAELRRLALKPSRNRTDIRAVHRLVGLLGWTAHMAA